MFLPFPLAMAACSYVGITDGNLIKGYIRECITMVKKNRSHLFAEVWCFQSFITLDRVDGLSSLVVVCSSEVA